METCLLWVLSFFICKLQSKWSWWPQRWPGISASGPKHEKVPLSGSRASSSCRLRSFLPRKFCISLRVHKSWHVCKERHSKNSYASPYNKHVVNNLYLEANLSQGCGQSFKSETLQECSVLFFTGSSRGSPTWRFEGSLYWRSRSPLPKKRGICINRCKRCIVISWELPFPMNVRLRTK